MKKYLADLRLSKQFFWFIWIVYVMYYMTKNCYSAAMASIVHEGVMTKTQTGAISGMFYLAYAPFQIVGGILADKYSPARLIKIGLIGSAVANFIIFLNQDYYVMLVVWTLNAMVQFGVWPSIFKIFTSQLAPEYRKKAIFYNSFSSSAGMIVAYVLAAFIGRWQNNFGVSALLLLVSAAAFHVVNKRMEAHMVQDSWHNYKVEKGSVTMPQMSTLKMFLVSGFFIGVVVTVLRTVVSQGVQTITPTLLMESYDTVSPTLGNLLNTLIIASGLIGVLVVKLILYPKYIKNEAVGALIMLVLAIPFAVFLRFVGKVEVAVIVVSMCVIAALLTAMGLFSSFMNMSYGKYGHSGIAAGITNAASSLGFVLSSYVIPLISDKFGWMEVIYVWIALLVVSAIATAVWVPIWKRFGRM